MTVPRRSQSRFTGSPSTQSRAPGTISESTATLKWAHAVWLLLVGLGGGALGAELSHDTFGEGAASFQLEFVTIAHLGNADDPFAGPYPLGQVGYSYRIGKYEVSEDMVAKANALGSLGITFSSTGTNKPVTMVTFYEVAQFVNWLNSSAGHAPAYRFNERGDWLMWSSDDAWKLDGLNLYRHKDAFYFIPSADEWYKAAYYNGTNYFRYATGSNATPVPVASGTDARTSVYAQSEESGPADVDDAGALSPYGTMAQGGNVWEWVETALDGINDATDKLLQIRGGHWGSGTSGIRASGSNSGRPWHGTGLTIGFRVAARLPKTPTAPQLMLRPDPEGGGLELSWMSETGVEYDVERSASPAGDFITFETLSGTGGMLRYVFRPVREGEAFYRVVAVRVEL